MLSPTISDVARAYPQVQRRAAMLWSHLLVSALCTSLVYSQTASVEEASNPIFQSKVGVVLVDVVVTDKNGQAVRGLTKDNFEILEGAGGSTAEKQTIVSFEEHNGAPPQVPSRPRLPAHFYTNAPSGPPTDSINILLLDALNTHSEDQATVHREMVSYLKSIDPGPRLAIFTLSSRLQMVEGFSSDPRVLLEALNHKKWGGQPQASTLLRSDAEDTGEQKMLQAMADEHGNNDAIQALQRFLSTGRCHGGGSARP